MQKKIFFLLNALIKTIKHMKSKKSKQEVVSDKTTQLTEDVTSDASTTISPSTECNFKDLYEAQVKQNEVLNTECLEWKAKAQSYGEKFAQALKGFLITQGKPVYFAEAQRQKVLHDIKLI